MPSFAEHCAQAVALCGNAHEEVHRWLDEFAGQQPWGSRHRKFRHHLAGIEQVRRMFGEEAALVARQHIMADMQREGWSEHEHPFPANADDYRRLGLW